MESKLKSHNSHTINLTDVVGDASNFKDYSVNCFSRKYVLIQVADKILEHK